MTLIPALFVVYTYFFSQTVASKAADLLTALTSLASTCSVIASYWTVEGARFLADDRSGKAVVASDDNLAFWKQAKSDFATYVTVMTHVTSIFNFHTDAKLPPYQTLHFKSLGLNLQVPADLDVKNTMAK